MAWLLAATVGCGGKLLVSGQGEAARFRHRELGYEIAYPGVLGEPGWSTEALDASDLLVRHEDGAAWALSSSCRATATPVELLAAELARAAGGGGRDRSGRPIRHAGLEGWMQRLETREDGTMLAIKTVTLRGPRCTYDWILVAPTIARLEDLESAFDVWWQSFVPGPGDRPGGSLEEEAS